MSKAASGSARFAGLRGGSCRSSAWILLLQSCMYITVRLLIMWPTHGRSVGYNIYDAGRWQVLSNVLTL